MQVQVNVKRIGKRRNAIETRPYEIGEVRDVGELIAAFVTAVRYLTNEDVADAATVGKIGFSADYNGGVQDTTAAIENARQSFEDGIYRIFINGEEAGETCDTPVTLHENDEITFVRLTMLAGRMW